MGAGAEGEVRPCAWKWEWELKSRIENEEGADPGAASSRRGDRDRDRDRDRETDREKRRFTNAHRAQRREKKQGSELTRSSASLLELSRRSKLAT